MSDYPQRVEKSENIYRLWETGEGDMGELAIGLYNLTADYKSLWDDYTKLKAELSQREQDCIDRTVEAHVAEAENKRLREGIDMAHLHLLASVCDCGEPLKETDAFDCLDALKEVDDAR